jgi:hypothetical protein
MGSAPPPDSRRPPADEFAVRYYRWALDDARREVRENFPLLRAVKSGLTMRAVAYFESRADDERRSTAMALVKRSHRRAVELTGDSWGAADEAVDRDYSSAARTARPEEESYRQTLLHSPDTLTIDRGRFLTAVKAQLASVLGAGEPFSTKHEWRYDTSFGPWTLVTLIDVGGSAHQLAYSHALQASGSKPLREGVSLCGWLGLGGGHTTWNRLTPPDTVEAAQSLARVCAHFVQAVPPLVAGLVPN